VLYTAAPGKKTSALAALTASRMLGSMLGTPVGGVLFDLIDWAPANILGGLTLLLPLIAFFKDVTARVEKMEVESDSGLQFFQMPKFVVANLMALLSLIITYVPVPFLQPYFSNTYGISKSLFGLIFFGVVMLGVGGATAAGPVLEEKIGTVPMLRWATLTVGIGLFMVGPSPLIGLGWTELAVLAEWGSGAGGPALMPGVGIWEPIIAFSVTFFGNGLFMILCPPWTLKMAAKYGMGEEEATVKTASYTIVSMAISQFLGPVPGSLLAHHYGVGWACTILSISAVILSATLLLIFDRIVAADTAKVNEMV